MATLEDKIEGIQLHNYCSSSEEEDNCDDQDGAKGGEGKPSSISKMHLNKDGPPPPPPGMDSWSGNSSNTGPKGVLQDWQQFKMLEAEKRMLQDIAKAEMAKKMSMTARTVEEDLKQKEMDELDAELLELMSEDVLQQFQKQRMSEMMQKWDPTKKFGTVMELRNGEEFLNAIDNEDARTSVLVHIYDNFSVTCRTMNKCLDQLAKQYVVVKFCKINASAAAMSSDFKEKGVPTLLVYQKGQLIGNFVQITNQLGEDFFASDVAEFLIENGMLPEAPCVPSFNTQADDDE